MFCNIFLFFLVCYNFSRSVFVKNEKIKPEIIEQNIKNIQFCIDLLDYFEIKFCDFSLIGPHIRHVIGHYEIFLNSISNKMEINYDNRARCKKQETDIEVAKLALHKTIKEINNLKHNVLEKTCVIDLPSEKTKYKSSYKREMSFLNNHTIHHQAIIKFLLKNENIILPDDFGKSSATLEYEKNIKIETTV